MKNRLERIYEQSSSHAEYARGYAERLQELLAELDFGAIERASQLMRDTRDAGGTIYLAGNGGSAAVCSHMANDLGAMASEGAKRPFRALSLTDNTSFITALANDAGFENIFVNQLLSVFEPGDLLVVMSGSGNSENLIRAVNYCNEKGGRSLGVLGFDGGIMKSLCHDVVHFETEKREYGPVEDLFMILVHMLSTYLAFDLGLFGKPETHPCHRVVDETSVKS